VLVEAFRPGKLGALGLDPQELLERFPRLIICSLSGFGQTGSMAQVAGHDLNYVAHAGVLGLFGPAGRPPGVPGVQIGDVGGGSLPAAMGVLAALLERQRTGRGRHLDISLTRGAVAFGGIAFAQAATGFVEERGAGFLTGGAPCCRCFETRDGRFVAFSALEPHFFATFCNLVDRPDLSRKGYARGEEAAQVAAELAAVFAERDLAAWLELADGEDVCLTAVRTAAEAMADPEFASVVRQVDGHTVVTTHVGVDLPTPSRGPSELGADVAAVVERLGLPEAVVQAARQSGALVWSE
jgi:alpha-methylacyl-CoA racemase